MPSIIRHTSPCGGSWYPNDRAELENLLDELFETSLGRTGPLLLPQPAAFVVPHAGLTYSGRVAAAVYRHLQQAQPSRVILLGLSHRGAPAGVWIPRVDVFETPLGEVPVDGESVERLLTHSGFRPGRKGVLCDHSVEVQLPLLQKAAPGAAVVPIYVSELSAAERDQAASVLAEMAGPDTVVLASSDFTHYGRSFHYQPFPLDPAISTRLAALDEGFIEAAGSLDPELFVSALDAESATVCGREPISLLLAMLRSMPGGDDIFQNTLDYETSGDITGDYTQSVGYAALGYFPWDSFRLGDDDQKSLLESAKETLRHYQETGEAKPIPPAESPVTLKRPCGVFVTLRQRGRLRGCVGRCTTSEPMAQVVPAMTLAAALEDSRFDSLRPEERDVSVEISVLSPMKRLPDTSRFRVNLNGGYLKAKGSSGLLLPHVAKGRSWTSQNFLHALAHKTGVDKDVYEDPDTRLFVFRSQSIA